MADKEVLVMTTDGRSESQVRIEQFIRQYAKEEQ